MLGNLDVGRKESKTKNNKWSHERIYQLFPVLKDFSNRHGGTLSGGEQQMLAIARALLARPKVLVMDEPSMGLSPVFVENTFEIIQELNRQANEISKTIGQATSPDQRELPCAQALKAVPGL